MQRRLLRAACQCVLAAILLLRGVSQTSSKGFVFLVRHAAKASQEPRATLSQQGHKRAKCLSDLLQDAGITGIYVTDFVRTQQTAEPIAIRNFSDNYPRTRHRHSCVETAFGFGKERSRGWTLR